MWLRLCAAVLTIALIGADTAQEQRELQIGQQVYNQLDGQGKILKDSPYYSVLAPLGQRIAASAGNQYFAPFHFILVHDRSPNAFSVPGGNIYVTDSMMTLVQNKEELAGVLCHEVSHTIHHDVWDLYVKNQRISLWSMLAQLLIGGHSSMVASGINLLANIEVLHFSRDVEHNADMTGAYVCAQAGLTPWGMVWMMQRFLEKHGGGNPEFLADHPTDSHRIADLQRLFAENPQTFSKFNKTLANATPVDEDGLRDQYIAEAAPPPSPSPTVTPIPAGPRAKPTCPPGWKFCPPG